jgi:Zn-dependent protease with chaperone function
MLATLVFPHQLFKQHPAIKNRLERLSYAKPDKKIMPVTIAYIS